MTTTMPLRRAGRSGLYLSALGLGLGRWGAPNHASSASCVSAEDGFSILERALELGVTHWDTASGYGEGESERIVGAFFAARGAEVRDQVTLSTKWMGAQGGGRGAIRKAVDSCLRRLRTEYLDVFMLHNPGMDMEGRYLAPVEETWGALADLVHQGKIHYLGVSNAHGINVRDAVTTLHGTGVGLTLVENCYNLLQPGQVGRGLWTDWAHGSSETAFLRELATLGIGLIPFWPLCMGALTGAYRKAHLTAYHSLNETFRAQFLEGRTLEAIEALCGVAERKGLSLAALAIAWLLSKEIVSSVITGVTRLSQLEENARVVGVTLTADEITELEAIAATAESVDDFCRRKFGTP